MNEVSQHIGVGVGAMVFNEAGKVFLAKRGPMARNERGCWEFPGGSVHFGETLKDGLIREFLEEFNMQIEVMELLCVVDHILPAEGQHWVSPTYIARHTSGGPTIQEPDKCTSIGWFEMDVLPQPLSKVSQASVAAFDEKEMGLRHPTL
jgi:8-oxo-dGTP diphosphatase